MRRLPITGALLITLAVVLGVAAPASGQDGAATPGCASAAGDPGRVSVIKVEGLIDPVLADFIDRSITEGEDAGVVAVVLQLDSEGAVIDDDRLLELATHISEAEVPVAVWVGPSGSVARGGAAQLAGVADPLGIAPGARLGDTGTIDDDLLALTSPAFQAAAEGLDGGTLNDEEARKLDLVPNQEAPVIGEFLLDVPGFQCKEVKAEGRTVREPLTVPVFSALPIQDQLFHTVSSPPAAYLLFVIGLSLIIFELFTAGVGVAGLVGAGCFVLSCYGMANLPVRPVGLALLVLAMFGYSVDVQTGVPRVWSAIATAALIVGSLTLYDGFSLSWITLLVGIVGVAAAMVAGMPAMVRTRFSTPTIGREWMIGEEGEAVTVVSPEGVVRVRGALWRARTNRATPIELRGGIRVVEVDGLLLEVEPLEGGAIDYREKRRGGDADDGAEAEGDDGVVLVDGKPIDQS